MATHGRQRTVSNSGSVDKTAEMCLQISQKNQEQSSLLRLSVEVRFMIYGLLFEQDPKRNWVFSFKGEEWNPPSSPLIISDEDTWHKAPKHQVALFKACRQTQAETRPLIINTEKDAFEFWGFNALDRFAQTYASAQLTSLTFVAEIDDSHSPDLDNFVVLFQNAGFPKLKRMKIVAKDGERDLDYESFSMTL
ncbi:hypothetical protein P171DRAFT_474905 [Karstenula rhodostoma CBS 690.94]|uniref:Uncharacterized protein n=1 Tax=Karstenula rhodostoma CBS 690.94 TaxID=1392251 RepID=A0A9P4PCN9_9PLEO|nr:hypothetical protein P171DRAFT_474905 [Karstenula rhodostoma CBS 690.94]